MRQTLLLADFMKMPFLDNSFDAAYAIEATCHAPNATLPLLHSSKDKDQAKKKGETKKPATPYIMWCKEHWTEVKNENPESELSEMANILGAKWKALTPDEKKPYEEKYQIEKAAYVKIVGSEKREIEAMKLLEEEQKRLM